MSAEGLTNIGLKREENQDTLLIRKDINLYMVADGMGGHDNGHIASSIAVNVVEEHFSKEFKKGVPLVRLLTNAVEKANKIIYECSKKESQDIVMGTTLTTALIENDTAYIAHVGDSRAYLMNKNGISLITTDHSYVGELIRNGSLSEEEAISHPKRNILTRAVGVEPYVNIDIFEVHLKKNDYLVLCTDGLFNALTKEKIYQIIFSISNLKDAVKQLIDEALINGGNDNITVVVYKSD